MQRVQGIPQPDGAWQAFQGFGGDIEHIATAPTREQAAQALAAYEAGKEGN